MKLMTRQTLANAAYERYRKQYPRYPCGSKDVKTSLKALGPTPNPDDVDKVTGVNSWTQLDSCSECGHVTNSVVHFGQEPDYNAMYAFICFDCLVKALGLYSCVDNVNIKVDIKI